jgi:hypothetical protein
MTKNKEMKGNIIKIILSLVVALIAYFSFNYFNPGIEDMLSVIIFILILILLKQK